MDKLTCRKRKCTKYSDSENDNKKQKTIKKIYCK